MNISSSFFLRKVCDLYSLSLFYQLLQEIIMARKKVPKKGVTLRKDPHPERGMLGVESRPASQTGVTVDNLFGERSEDDEEEELDADNDDEETQERIFDSDEEEAATIAGRQHNKRKRSTPNRLISSQSSSSSSSNAITSTPSESVVPQPGSSDYANINHPLYGVMQDLSGITCGSWSRGTQVNCRLKASVSEEDLSINVNAAMRVDAFQTSCDPYIKKLEYPHLWVKLRGHVVFLDPHINLVIKYMMTHLQKDGLAATNVLPTAIDACSRMNFFCEGDPLISRALVAHITSCTVFYRSLNRIAENFKNMLKTKSNALKPSLFKLLPRFDEATLDRVVQDVPHVILREVKELCIYVLYILFVFCFIVVYHL